VNFSPKTCRLKVFIRYYQYLVMTDESVIGTAFLIKQNRKTNNYENVLNAISVAATVFSIHLYVRKQEW